MRRGPYAGRVSFPFPWRELAQLGRYVDKPDHELTADERAEIRDTIGRLRRYIERDGSGGARRDKLDELGRQLDELDRRLGPHAIH